MKDQEAEAYADYRNRIASYGGQTNNTIQALLIHWSHEELFFQLQPRGVQSDLEPNQLFVNASSEAK